MDADEHLMSTLRTALGGWEDGCTVPREPQAHPGNTSQARQVKSRCARLRWPRPQRRLVTDERTEAQGSS
jgi:hypothetical protein